MVGQCDIDLQPLHWPHVVRRLMQLGGRGSSPVLPLLTNPGRKVPRTWRAVKSFVEQ
jgi:hypothetical protein